MRRLLLWLFLGAVIAGLWGAAALVQQARVQVATLPGRVHADLAARNETYVGLQAVPSALVEATVAVEDRTFWTNPGFSAQGLARAALVDVASEGWVEGGSTITQQLVRGELLSYRKTLRRKAMEIVYAVVATRRFPKDEILELYLNAINYGHGSFGIGAAAETYFALPVADLDLAQAALVAGVPQNPVGLDPLVHPAAARARQQLVLTAMVQAGYITKAQAQAAAARPWGLVPAP